MLFLKIDVYLLFLFMVPCVQKLKKNKFFYLMHFLFLYFFFKKYIKNGFGGYVVSLIIFNKLILIFYKHCFIKIILFHYIEKGKKTKFFKLY